MIDEKTFKELMAQEDSEIIALNNAIHQHRKKKREYKQEYIEFLKEKFKEYLGKKVKVEHNGFPVCGFFKGFKENDYGDYIKPVLLKIKKDGTASMKEYPLYDMPIVNDEFEIEVQ